MSGNQLPPDADELEIAHMRGAQEIMRGLRADSFNLITQLHHGAVVRMSQDQASLRDLASAPEKLFFKTGELSFKFLRHSPVPIIYEKLISPDPGSNEVLYVFIPHTADENPHEAYYSRSMPRPQQVFFAAGVEHEDHTAVLQTWYGLARSGEPNNEYFEFFRQDAESSDVFVFADDTRLEKGDSMFNKDDVPITLPINRIDPRLQDVFNLKFKVQNFDAVEQAMN